MSWTATCLTLFPDAFPGVLETSVIGTARDDGLWTLETVNIRDFATDKHRSVDGPPAGGGAGMVLKPDVAAAAIDSVERGGRPLIYLSPRGIPLTQSMVKEFAAGPGVILFSGRFEGLDQRVIDSRKMIEVSIGDYVLAGGEVAAQVLIEACVRLLPGVLGAANSTEEESFESGLLEYPQYTKPRVWESLEIPAVLTSGDHGKVEKWRKDAAKQLTKARRPDLWADFTDRMESPDECD